MARGQDGSLRLSCMTLSFTAPRRFIPTLSSPGGILGRHGSDEIAKLGGDFRSAGTVARKKAPVPAEPGAMPAHDGLRLHDHQHARPFGPPSRRPSQNRRSHGLNWGRGFLRLRTPTCCRKATSSSPRPCRERKRHRTKREKPEETGSWGPSLRDSVDRKSDSCKLLILRSNRILTTDRVRHWQIDAL